MAVEFEWTWGPMIVETVDEIPDVVTGIHWICVAKDFDLNPTMDGKKTGILFAPQPDPTNFITIDNITANIVQNWIDIGMSVSDIENETSGFLQQQNNSTNFRAAPIELSNKLGNPIDPLSNPIQE